MIKITCDVCECNIPRSTQIDLSEMVHYLTEHYAKMDNPDICSNCIDDLKKAVQEAVIQWKLAKGRKE